MDRLIEEVVALRPLLVRIARRRLRNDAWAEDAVSETVIAALEKPDAFAGRAKTQTWLVGILRHKLVDQIRRHTRECALESWSDAGDADGNEDIANESAATWGDPQQSLVEREFVAHVDQCLRALPPLQERAFVLREWLGHETTDVCREMGITANHLGVMLYRARHRLRATLAPQWMPAAA